MPRSTEKAVKDIMDTELTKEQLTPFLRTADNLVTKIIVDAGADYSAEILTDIVTWLAAHFACARDPEIARENVGEAGWTFNGQTGLGLNATRYGQQVKILDYKGHLASLDGAKGKRMFEVMP